MKGANSSQWRAGLFVHWGVINVEVLMVLVC